MSRFHSFFLAALCIGTAARGQSPVASVAPPSVAPASAPAPSGRKGDTVLAPSWETQRHANAYVLAIPAPRGQIVDRNGAPLAQTRVSHNLTLAFPAPPKFSDAEALAYGRREVARAQTLINRPITFNADAMRKHYKNRAALPWLIAQDLKPAELEAVKRAKLESLVLQPVYLRVYPNGALAAHIIGYAGRAEYYSTRKSVPAAFYHTGLQFGPL